MPVEEYLLSAEDAVETVAQLLERDDVRGVRVEDADGETLVDVPGTASPEAGAREVMDRWHDYDTGAGSEVRVIAYTGSPPDGPGHGRILDEPPEHPEEGEPRPHG
jgi:hypothetical protein